MPVKGGLEGVSDEEQDLGGKDEELYDVFPDALRVTENTPIASDTSDGETSVVEEKEVNFRAVMPHAYPITEQQLLPQVSDSIIRAMKQVDFISNLDVCHSLDYSYFCLLNPPALATTNPINAIPGACDYQDDSRA